MRTGTGAIAPLFPFLLAAAGRYFAGETAMLPAFAVLPGDGELSRGIEDPGKERKKGNGQTASRPK
jgi:hypothetical protein